MTVHWAPGRVAFLIASHLIRPAMVIGMMAAPIVAADAPTVVPLGCNINWTRTGGVWIFFPDCPRPSPARPSPNGPPPGDRAQPQQVPPPAN